MNKLYISILEMLKRWAISVWIFFLVNVAIKWVSAMKRENEIMNEVN